MNTAFWHIVWKEYRAVRGLWISVVALAVLVQAAFVTLKIPTDAVFATALVAAALFVVGCMATLFAAEREEETIRYLQIIPGTWRPVIIGKLSFAALSVVALVCVLYMTGTMVAGRWSSAHETLVHDAQVYGVAVIECAVWAAFFSLLSRRPLVSAIASIAAASVTAHVAIWLAAPGFMHAWDGEIYRQAWLARLVLAAMVALAAGSVSRHWLCGVATREDNPFLLRRLLSRKWQTSSIGDAAMKELPRSSAFPIIVRLLWQSLRQSLWLAVICVLLAAPVAGAVAKTLSLMSETTIVPWWIGLSALLGAALGTFVFLADQVNRSHRFFSEHGERPGLVWLARLLFWGSTALLMVTIMHLAVGYGLLGQPFAEALKQVSGIGDVWVMPKEEARFVLLEVTDALADLWSAIPLVGFSIVLALGGFCIGQCGSMFMQSGIIAWFTASLSVLVLAGWATVMWSWGLYGQLAWTILGIPIAFLLATRLRIRAWLFGRHDLRSWLAPTAAIVLPMLAMIISVPSSRLYLPLNVWLKNGLNHLNGAAADFRLQRQVLARDGRATADLYLRACDLLVPRSSPLHEDDLVVSLAQIGGVQLKDYLRLRSEWIEQNADALARTLEATAQTQCYFPPEMMKQNSRRAGELLELRVLLFESAKQLGAQGDLAAAWERLLLSERMTQHWRQGQQSWTWARFQFKPLYDAIADWAREDGQHPEHLRKAIGSLARTSANSPPLAEAVLADRADLHSILRGEEAPSGESPSLTEITSLLAQLEQRLAWERERGRRVLDALSAERLAVAQQFGGRVAKNEPLAGFVRSWQYSPARVIGPLSVQVKWSWLQSTHFLRQHYGSLPTIWNLTEHVAMDEQRRQALLLELALIAYKIDHGDYPLSFAALEGEYLDQVPLDPFATETRSFHYHPRGLDGWLTGTSYGLLRPGTPFFWSGGLEGQPLHHALNVDRVLMRPPTAEHEAEWQSLEGRPLYELSDSETGCIVILMPTSVDAADTELRPGRHPAKDGVPVQVSAYGNFGNSSGYGGVDGAYGEPGYSGGYGASTYLPGFGAPYDPLSPEPGAEDRGIFTPHRNEGRPPGDNLPSRQ